MVASFSMGRNSATWSVSPCTRILLLTLATWNTLPSLVQAECLANTEFNDFFEGLVGAPIPSEGSCCMFDVCGLECPVDVPEPSNGFGIAVAISIVISFLIGIATFFVVKGQSVNFFVAGRSLPLWIVSMTLAAQSIDSNAILGNADLSYKFGFYDGAVIPIGLGLSLILNGIFLAHHVNNDEVLTLPDIFAKRYGKVVEILVSLTTICSFLMLLAGNLVGFGAITSYVWGISDTAAIWIAAGIVWVYTASGGLFSVAYTDVVQGLMGWSGCIVMAFWFIANEEPNAPPPSIGYPLYVYPDNIGDGGVCDMYDGVPCAVTADACCYNIERWCPEFNVTGQCERFDRGAYPVGDQRIFSDQMSNFRALTPFPNAIFWNWATIFILGFGNLAALDFQARCMASKTPRTARIGCIIGGLFTFLIGIPFAYMGAISRVYYGPDSIHAEFEVDTCLSQLALPTCGLWLPDKNAFIKLLTHQAPDFLGGWCLVGIVAASMSTADGAILAMGTVFAHNIMRQFDEWIPNLVTPDNLLVTARVATLPFTLISTFIAAFYRSSHSAGATGYLLIVAFDIVLATVVVPLFGCFYCKNPSPRAAFVAIIGGAITRVVLEFALPKDGFLLLPYDAPEFLNTGPGASTGTPVFWDVDPGDMWDETVEPCVQESFEDFTGVDSLSAFLVCILSFVSVQTIEHCTGKPLFSFAGMQGYHKDTTEHPLKGSSIDKMDETAFQDDTTKRGNPDADEGDA
ncbi:predicted protein [Phaeodactylum tricornutum CCAP 1055/1]|uniref:Uncharacterized protein n=2 Tax=Phaeodactylum tricornutum TaxID=2850 RepID=B7GCN8_PHATC|nr:predicted protein [Phaeodactylum tricornutum CCAP 1055/1]EEC43573.1 predicted protein [Phaeodactylum tricornutum CCAP 1055/1]|eukprot:XP_002184837.1 predicted protein [Phaeodactylum tricornutum CCAP 1055/1]